MAVERLVLWGTRRVEMNCLTAVRTYFDQWQSQGHETRPDWYDAYIDMRINGLTNEELLDLLDTLEGTL